MALPLLNKISNAGKSAISFAEDASGISLSNITRSITSSSGLGSMAGKLTNSSLLGTIVERSVDSLTEIKDSIVDVFNTRKQEEDRESAKHIRQIDDNIEVLASNDNEWQDETLNLFKLIEDNTARTWQQVYGSNAILVGLATNAARARLEKYHEMQFAEEEKIETQNTNEAILDELEKLNNNQAASGTSEKKKGPFDFLGNFLGNLSAQAVGGTLKKAIGFFSLGKIAGMLRIIPGLGYVVAAGYLVYEYWEEIKQIFSGIGEGLKETWDVLKPAINQLQESLEGIWDSVMQIVQPLYDSIIKPLIDSVHKLMGGKDEKGMSTAKKLGKIIGAGLGLLGTAIVTTFTMIADIINFTVKTITWIGKAVIDLSKWLGRNIVQPYIDFQKYIWNFEYLDDMGDFAKTIGKKLYNWWDEMIEKIRGFLIDSFNDKGAIGRKIARQFMTPEEIREQDLRQKIVKLEKEKREKELALKNNSAYNIFGPNTDRLKTQINDINKDLASSKTALQKEKLGMTVVKTAPAKLHSLTQNIDDLEEKKKNGKSNNIAVTNVSAPKTSIVQNSGTAIVAPSNVRNNNLSFR